VVSVIIVNYNAGELLSQCVSSVLASTMEVEIFVVDNASHDDSLALLKQTVLQDKRVHIVENKENVGFAAASNQILAETQGDYLLFLNPDCLIQADTLEKFVNTMQNYPQAGMAGALVRNFDGTEQAGCRRSIPSPWRSVVRVLHLDKFFPNSPKFKSFVLTKTDLPNEPIEIEGISGACMFVRRKALQEVGAMDETYFLHCEDLDWFMRFHQHDWKILFIPDIEVSHAKGACSQQQPVRVLWYKHRGMVKFYRKFFKQRYSILLFWSVVVAVWLRFILLAAIISVKGNK